LDWVDSDVEGSALQFDGADDYVGFQNMILDLNTGYCISFWIKADYFPGTTYIGLIGNISESYAKAIYFSANGSYIIGETNTNEDNFVHTSSFGSFQTGEWYYFVATGETGSYRTYINGNKVYEFTSLSNNILTLNSIGKMGTRNSFSGIIDEMHIYAKALSSAEIQNLYVKGLKKLFGDNSITQKEYDQKMEEFE